VDAKQIWWWVCLCVALAWWWRLLSLEDGRTGGVFMRPEGEASGEGGFYICLDSVLGRWMGRSPPTARDILPSRRGTCCCPPCPFFSPSSTSTTHPPRGTYAVNLFGFSYNFFSFEDG
jgi:hypothetical protein